MARITGDEIAEYVRGARPDMANDVVHWTDLTYKAADPSSLRSCMMPVPDLSPFDVLQRIISDRRIRASSRAIKGGAPVVCFSEGPLWAMKVAYSVARFNRSSSMFDDQKFGRCLNYRPYGLLFSKRTIYNMFGGRPVLYLSESEQRQLPASMQWRTHKLEALGGHGAVDFSHEREWRCPSDVDLDKLAQDERPMAIVWTVDEREKLQALASGNLAPVSDVIALSELGN